MKLCGDHNFMVKYEKQKMYVNRKSGQEQRTVKLKN